MRKIPGSQRAVVEKTDELFPIAELGSQFGLGSQQRVKDAVVASDPPKKNTRKPLRRKRFQLVEMGGSNPRPLTCEADLGQLVRSRKCGKSAAEQGKNGRHRPPAYAPVRLVSRHWESIGSHERLAGRVASNPPRTTSALKSTPLTIGISPKSPLRESAVSS